MRVKQKNLFYTFFSLLQFILRTIRKKLHRQQFQPLAKTFDFVETSAVRFGAKCEYFFTNIFLWLVRWPKKFSAWHGIFREAMFHKPILHEPRQRLYEFGWAILVVSYYVKQCKSSLDFITKLQDATKEFPQDGISANGKLPSVLWNLLQ